MFVYTVYPTPGVKRKQPARRVERVSRTKAAGLVEGGRIIQNEITDPLQEVHRPQKVTRSHGLGRDHTEVSDGLQAARERSDWGRKEMKKIAAVVMLCVLPVIFVSCGAGSSNNGNSVSAPAWAETMPLTTDILTDSGNPVLELIAVSYSASAFTAGEVSQRDVERILTCGMKAPSAKNAQPWHFTVVGNYETVSRLLKQAKDGNVVIVISGKRDISTDTMKFDCGLAAQNMQLAAESLGFGARMFIEPVREIEKNQRDRLGIPDGYDVLAALLVGYVDESVDAVASATPRDTLLGHVNYAP